MRGNERDPIFLLGLGDEHDGLARRIQALGFRPVRAENPEAAALFLSRLERPVRAAILPGRDDFADRASELAKLARATGGMRFIVVGKPPSPDEIDALRRDGVRFCLWNSFSDNELRFVLNRALYDTTRGEVRDRTRVPTALVATVRSGAGEKKANVYNLSSTGAFLETQRTGLKGGRVSVTLALPTGDVELNARVVSTNVPGNLKRGNLPLGMGVAFIDPEPEARAALELFVAQRIRAFEL